MRWAPEEWRVGRLLVFESLLLAALSGVAALGVAAFAGRMLRDTLLPAISVGPAAPLDGTAIVFTAVALLAVGPRGRTVPRRLRGAVHGD